MWWFLLVMIGVGGLAQLIDGSLGMGFGVSGSSLLVTIGLAPAIASASVHTAEVVTTLASGTAHLRLGNVDKSIFVSLVVPGCLGGIIGAIFLSGMNPNDARPAVGTILFVLGAFILFRFLRKTVPKVRAKSKTRVALLGFCAATIDAFGGGGWGPIATPGLILSENHDPRKAIGTVNLAEFFVTVSITATFMILLGAQNLPWDWVAAIAVGGVVIAPFAAYATKRIPTPSLGVLVGVLLMLLNGKTIVGYFLPLSPYLLTLTTAGALAVMAVTVLWKAIRPSTA